MDVRLLPLPWELFRRLLGISLPAGGEGLSYNLSQSTSLVFVNMIGTYAVTARIIHEHVRTNLLHAGKRGQPGGRHPDRLLHRRKEVTRGPTGKTGGCCGFRPPVTVGTALLLALLPSLCLGCSAATRRSLPWAGR